MLVLVLAGWGMYSFRHIPIDAVPDITTNQVQVITQSPTLAAQEVEQFVTFPVEVALANLPDVVEIRSLSRFGLSVVTVVFEEDADIYRSRQLISQQLKIAEREIPEGFGSPGLGPITTGLGEVYQYVLRKAPGYDTVYSDMDLRTINDWIVIRQLAGTPGIIEVSGWGGHLKQYEVAVNPERLNGMNVSIADVFDALAANNENTGGSYIEKRYNTYFIRGEGLVKTRDDIENIVVRTVAGIPVLVRDVATVGFGSAPRYGAITCNAQGEVVGGQALMLKGENSYEVVNAVKERIQTIKKSLPEGVVLEPFIDRSELIGRAIGTVTKNLVEGGLIVILILVLLLGNFRGGLIVASVIPLSMLFAMGMMNLFGISANLMSLGAIDFGLIVDGAVIIVEGTAYRLSTLADGRSLSRRALDDHAREAATGLQRSASFGMLIILIVYLPILALVGIEGKMFRPMAQTVCFAIAGALLLSLTYVPMMSALFLRPGAAGKRTLSDRIMSRLQRMYAPALRYALRKKAVVVTAALALFAASLFTFHRLGGEFIPTLEEGDLALHQILPPGSSLQQSIEVSKKIQRVLLDSFPEVITVVSKMGTGEVPTDPMPIEVGDIMIRMKPKDEWVSAASREELFEKMKRVLSAIPGVEYEFTQPIQMRFNELIAGVREDIAIKIFGENPDVLFQKAEQAEALIRDIDGVGDLRVEQTRGLPQMMVIYERSQIARYGLNIRDLNTTLRAAFAGETAGVVFEEERRFDLVVRLDKDYRREIDHIRNLYVPLPGGGRIPLKEVARIEFRSGPMQISREDARRRIVIGVNARHRDTESLVQEIRDRLDAGLDLPPGYSIRYGGQFENLIAAKERLAWAVPAALLLIFMLLYLAFGSVRQALMIFTAVPLAAIGGVYALWLRDMPFSISAGIGFIALFGVAVLNGIVLVASFNQLKKEGMSDMHERILAGTRARLRPVIMTASVAALGFLPMALSASAGAEVQRPLATVVIGGLVSATLLTLLVLPVLYSLLGGIGRRPGKGRRVIAPAVLLLVGLAGTECHAQATVPLTLEEAVQRARSFHPSLRAARLGVEQQQKLRKTAFELDNTVVSYSTGQLNGSAIDYQWQVTQGFRFPTRYLGRARLQKERVTLEERSLAATEQELEHRVRSAWLHAAYAQQRLRMLDDLAAAYARFADVAARRYAAGDIALLEKARTESRHREMLLQRQEAEAGLDASLNRLQLLTGCDTAVTVPVEQPFRLDPPADGPSPADIPAVGYLEQRVTVADQVFRTEKAGFLPDLSVGYFNQQVEGVGGLDGLQLGLGIPLFFWTQQGKVQAAKLGRQIARAEYESELLAATARYEAQRREVAALLERISWYESQGLTTADELIRVAEKGYRQGETGYLEYIGSLQQAADIRMKYLETLNDYNQAVTDLRFPATRHNE